MAESIAMGCPCGGNPSKWCRIPSCNNPCSVSSASNLSSCAGVGKSPQIKSQATSTKVLSSANSSIG